MDIGKCYHLRTHLLISIDNNAWLSTILFFYLIDDYLNVKPITQLLFALLLFASCFIVFPKAVNFFQQQDSSETKDLTLISDFDDVISFLKLSAEQAGLAITVEPAQPGQWQVSIARSPEKNLKTWLKHLNMEGLNIQSIQVLNTEAEGVVRVPSLTLITNTNSTF